jgi:hypothetical protein
MRSVVLIPTLILGAVVSASCGGSPTGEPEPALAIRRITVAAERDTAVVNVELTMPAQVRLAYVRDGRADTVYVERSLPQFGRVVLRALDYSQPYHLLATATAPGQQPVSHPAVSFTSAQAPDPCIPANAAAIQPVEVKFEFRPQPNPDESVLLQVFGSLNCDGSNIGGPNDLFLSLDGGHSLKGMFSIRPNHPYGSKPIILRVGLFRAGELVRWLGPGEFTLNGKSPSRLSAELPKPDNCSACRPGPGVAFNLNASGVIDP